MAGYSGSKPSASLRGAGRWRAAALLAVLFTAHASAAVTLVHHPYLQNLTHGRVTVMWSTRENVAGRVEFSTDQSFAQVSPASVRAFPDSLTGMTFTFYQQQAVLSGLLPGTEYRYRVIVDEENLTAGGEQRFHTPSQGRFTFLVFGDSGLGGLEQQALARQMAKEQPDLLLHVGDIAYETGTYEEFRTNHFDQYRTLLSRAPFFPVTGNHDYGTGMAAPFLALHTLPSDGVPLADRGRYYSFDWGDVHFIGLDSDLLEFGAARSRPMLDWLENDLRSTTARWRVAYFHHLPYPTTHHSGDPVCNLVKSAFVPVLERHNVQLVLSGHEHNYQRTVPMRGDRPAASGRATTYITSGGGGGGLHPVTVGDLLAKSAMAYQYVRVEVDANEMVARAIGQDGQELDSVTLANPSVRASAPVVNAASYSTTIAPGGLISIFGRGLAARSMTAAQYPLPTTLAGTSVYLDGAPLPLFYVANGQINAQLPADASGDLTLQVETASGSAEIPVTVADAAPAIFQGGVLHMNGTPVGDASPVKPGETLMIFATGLGALERPLPAGQAAPQSPPLRASSPVIVELGDIRVSPLFAGLTPGFAGLYQVNVVVPADLPASRYSLRLAVKGTVSNSAVLPLQGR